MVMFTDRVFQVLQGALKMEGVGLASALADQNSSSTDLIWSSSSLAVSLQVASPASWPGLVQYCTYVLYCTSAVRRYVGALTKIHCRQLSWLAPRKTRGQGDL